MLLVKWHVTHRRKTLNDICDFRVILITGFTLTVTWWTFFSFFFLSQLISKHSFLHGSNQTALHIPELPHSYHRSQGDLLSVHIHQTQNWTLTYHFPKRELTRKAGCPGQPMCISGTQAGAFQGEALGSLWDSSPRCWEGLLRVNESPGLGVRPLEQKHDSLV